MLLPIESETAFQRCHTVCSAITAQLKMSLAQGKVALTTKKEKVKSLKQFAKDGKI